MELSTLGRPSGGDRKRKQVRNQMRSKKRREDLKKLVDKTVRHEINAAEHRGDKDSLTVARELTSYVRAALAIVQPYEPNGAPRPGGDKQEFWTWLDKLRDLLALQLPYERPKLASITFREESAEDRKPYVTLYELRVRMEAKGLPTDDLDDEPLMLEHDAGDAPPK